MPAISQTIMKKLSLSLLSAATLNGLAESHVQHLAPVGVMGDHLHEKGGLMASYRYMFMRMEQNFDGTSRISDSDVLADPRFMVAPTDMDMEMHMLGFMYAPTDTLTFMAMVNLVELSMNHRRMDGLEFQTTSSGIGDSSIGALFRLNDNFHAGLGLLLPTADIEEDDFIPGPGETRLPYPMQLGSGSWGLAPSLTYRQFQNDWYWGGQASAKLLLDDNDQGYRLGDRFEFNAWAVKPINDSFSLSVRATFADWDDIDGRDADLRPLPVPTARPDLRGGSRLDLALGLNYFDQGTGLNAGIELGQTVWRDLDGPQLGSDWSLTAGIRFAF